MLESEVAGVRSPRLHHICNELRASIVDVLCSFVPLVCQSLKSEWSHPVQDALQFVGCRLLHANTRANEHPKVVSEDWVTQGVTLTLNYLLTFCLRSRLENSFQLTLETATDFPSSASSPCSHSRLSSFSTSSSGRSTNCAVACG